MNILAIIVPNASTWSAVLSHTLEISAVFGAEIAAIVNRGKDVME
jgi:hypothetical protein